LSVIEFAGFVAYYDYVGYEISHHLITTIIDRYDTSHPDIRIPNPAVKSNYITCCFTNPLFIEGEAAKKPPAVNRGLNIYLGIGIRLCRTELSEIFVA
jgi:hypothetical protein